MPVLVNMMIRICFAVCCLVVGFIKAGAQCMLPINTFPYQQGFEANDGNWVSGGTGSDWAWGTPTKTVISSAGSGTRCWVIGGLTGNSYTDGQASFLQSPCFDFTGLQHPYIEFKVFWEMEQQFDGGSFQYSVDGGANWSNVGSANDARNCLNENWFNNSSINYLSPLTSVRHGWSGNVQSTAGSCRGGNGSNGWVTAKHTMPALAGASSVIFRFIFGAGTICNNYNGFAVDDILIREATANQADFTYSCTNASTVIFTSTSTPCPTGFSWDFGDVASGASNTSSATNPTHSFSTPGTYTITLTVSGPDNVPATTTKQLTILGLATAVVSPADCISGTGGSAFVTISPASATANISWNSSPAQTGATAVGLSAQTYTVTASAVQTCTATADVIIPLDFSCIGIYFPSAFTPNGDGLNDLFGPLGSLAALSNYRFSVYDRWGQKVFSSTNPFEKWNGLLKGAFRGSAVFVWQAEFSLAGQAKELRKGTVTLIR